jgi:predicted SAM-dependent methyltransferase
MNEAVDIAATDLRVVNPLATAGFMGGAVWVHCGDSGLVYSTHDGDALRLLAAFATPSTVARALDALGGSADAPLMRRHLLEFIRIGALLKADAPAPVESEPADLVETHLSPIARDLDALASTLSAMSPEVIAGIGRETGVGLEARLMACKAAVAGLKRELDRRAPAWVQHQVAALDPPERGLSLHLGAGVDAIEGWINIDAWPSQLALDLRWGLPFADGAAERVFLSHTLEHLYYPHEVGALLGEIFRVLAPGGRVRIIVPDIEAAIGAYVENDRRFFAGRGESSWPGWSIETRLESFLGYAGVGPHPGMFAAAHKYGYDFETLAHALETAEFRDVLRSTFQGSADARLRIDDASAYAVAQVDGRYYSLFVEATK